MFGKSLRLPFSLAGIPLYVDVSFLLILPLMAWMIATRIPLWTSLWNIPNAASLQTGAMPYLLGFIAAAGLFTCVILHELGHSLVARAFGVPVRSITLWFLGGVARFDEMPRKPGLEAVIAIAGPIVSLLLAVFFGFLLFLTPTGPAGLFILAYLTSTNVGLAIFNLIPAIPLDGGRVLRSLLALAIPYTTATRAAAAVSKIAAILLGILAVLTGQLFLLLIAVFVYMAGSAETRASYLEELLRNDHVADIMHPVTRALPPDATVAQASQEMLAEHRPTLPVVDTDGSLLGIVSAPQLAHTPPTAPVSTIMARDFPTLRATDDAAAALHRINDSGLDFIPVIDAARHLLGLISAADLANLLRTRAQIPPTPSLPA